MSSGSIYSLLGIGRDATPKQVKRAWRLAQQKLHPDKNPGNQEALERCGHARATGAPFRPQTRPSLRPTATNLRLMAINDAYEAYTNSVSGVMTILIRLSERGRPCALNEVVPTHSVEEVKALIEEQITGVDRHADGDQDNVGIAKVPVEERRRMMHLRFNGVELEDHRTMGDYNIQAGSVVSLNDENDRPAAAPPSDAESDGDDSADETYGESEAEEAGEDEDEGEWEADDAYDEDELGEDLGDEDEWSDDSTVGDSGSETDDWLEDDEPEGCAEAAPIFGKTIAPRTPPLSA